VVNVLPSEQYGFLMDTKQVSIGYGVSSQNIREHKRINDEFVEGKHFVVGVRFSDSDPENKVYWTKRGIVRLGFFIKSKQSKQFRDWAEDLIIRVEELMQQGNSFPIQTKQLPKKRNHNRLTSERLIRLLQLTHRIEDSALRNEIVKQLMGGDE
jgi:hypothetical protein